jgi:hypothetical protein
MTLEHITGTLPEALSQVKPETIQHAREIMNERRTNLQLRDEWFWTADFPMYIVEYGEPVLYFAPRELNLIFRNIKDAWKQAKKSPDYKPKQTDIDDVVESVKTGQTLRVKFYDLDLIDQDSERFCHFEIDTERYAKLNEVQRAFAERVYGSGKAFEENMKMLKDSKIDTAKIFVPNPKYVREHAKGGAIGRLSSLCDFDGKSNFFANDGTMVFNDYSGLRGERKDK